jgi:riboflavin synthase
MLTYVGLKVKKEWSYASKSSGVILADVKLEEFDLQVTVHRDKFL